MKHIRNDYNERVQDSANLIPADEPVFLLRAQDEFSSFVVRLWADAVEARLGGPSQLTIEVRKHADLMDEWQKHQHVKIPDTPEKEFAKSEENSSFEINKTNSGMLAGIDSIGDFGVVVMDELKERYPGKFNSSGAMDYEWFEREIRPNNFIYVRNDVNSISFTLQNGRVAENGINGCRVETIVEAGMMILEEFDEQLTCYENELAINALEQALIHLKKRKADRA